jgi:hypothetical protein
MDTLVEVALLSQPIPAALLTDAMQQEEVVVLVGSVSMQSILQAPLSLPSAAAEVLVWSIPSLETQ